MARKEVDSIAEKTAPPETPGTGLQHGTEELMHFVKIPRERIAVLIGTKGEAKRRIEHATKTRIEVDSIEGEVMLSGKNAISLYTAKEIVAAIGRGFAPDKAELLLDSSYGYEVFNLKDYCRNEDDMSRLRGRIIGEEGKSRRIIEELTEVYISVYGKTIALIGPIDGLPIARRAIEMLLAGSRHAAVYKYLEQQHRKLRESRMYGG